MKQIILLTLLLASCRKPAVPTVTVGAALNISDTSDSFIGLSRAGVAVGDKNEWHRCSIDSGKTWFPARGGMCYIEDVIHAHPDDSELAALREENAALHEALRKSQGGSEFYGNKSSCCVRADTRPSPGPGGRSSEERLAALAAENSSLHRKVEMLLKKPPADYGRCFEVTEPTETDFKLEQKGKRQ